MADERADQANDLGLKIADLAIQLVGEIPDSSTAALQLKALPTKTQIFEFVNALVNGLVQEDNLPAIETCLTDVETITRLLVNAVEEFKKHTL